MKFLFSTYCIKTHICSDSYWYSQIEQVEKVEMTFSFLPIERIYQAVDILIGYVRKKLKFMAHLRHGFNSRTFFFYHCIIH